MKKKKKICWQKAVPFAIYMIAGGICGVSAINICETYLKEMNMVVFFAMFYISLYVMIFMQTVVHEVGHLVFGLLTGYGFSSFRIGSIMLIKQNGKLKIKRYKLAGTGGQCLMVPPALDEKGNMPYVLYNLGGALMNIICGVITLMIYIAVPQGIFGYILLCNTLMAFAIALTNGIPLKLGLVNNDGHNAISLGKDKNALHAFWQQLKINEANSQNIRLKDMPKEWFEVPNDADLTNSLTATIKVFNCSRLMDEHNFDEAKEEMKKLIYSDFAVLDIYKRLLVCDIAFCEMISSNDKSQVERLFDKQQKKLMRAMSKNPSVIRTLYAYSLLCEENEKNAERYLKSFEKVASSYPYTREIENERELMAKADEAKKRYAGGEE